MRVLGLDLGERRVGVAISDPEGIIASPLKTLELSKNSAARVAPLDFLSSSPTSSEADPKVVPIPSKALPFPPEASLPLTSPLATKVAELVRQYKVEGVVVGLPLSLDGTAGVAAQQATQQAKDLQSALGIQVFTHDERMTTVIAEDILRRGGVKGQKRKGVVDKIAAAVMLQSWLDCRRHNPSIQKSANTHDTI